LTEQQNSHSISKIVELIILCFLLPLFSVHFMHIFAAFASVV
jgi:hypothetical protein